jgi:hypothetical protein
MRWTSSAPARGRSSGTLAAIRSSSPAPRGPAPTIAIAARSVVMVPLGVFPVVNVVRGPTIPGGVLPILIEGGVTRHAQSGAPSSSSRARSPANASGRVR